MAYPEPDVHDIRIWKLNEQLSDLTIVNSLPAFRTLGPFVDSSGNGGHLTLMDAFPASAPSQLWDVGVPGALGERAFAIYEGTGGSQRDYLFSADSSPEPSIFTFSLIIRPYVLRPAVSGNIIQKPYNLSWTSPFKPFKIFTSSGSDGVWGVNIVVGGTRLTQLAGNNEVTAHLQLRPQQINSIGVTYDGNTLQLYANGYVGPALVVGGPIDWGNHLLWAIGGSQALGGATNDPINAAIQEIRIADVVRPASYFFDAAIALEADGGTGPPIVVITPAAFDSTHVTVTFDTTMTTTGELLEPGNYQVRGTGGLDDLVVSAVVLVNPTTVRITTTEMLQGGTYHLIVSNVLNVDGDVVFIAGVDFVGIGTAPGIVLISPLDGATDVPRPTDILFEFSDSGSGINESTIQISIEGVNAVVDGVIVHPFKGPRSYVELQPDGSWRVNIDSETNFTFGQVVDIVATVDDRAGNSASGGGGGI